jgi:organic hydroperoxide reductase OsmC/OhrA
MVDSCIPITMSTHRATVEWTRGGPFARKQFQRAHRWSFDGGLSVPAAASPEVVPLPQTRADAIDPEEAFVAAISSCHMMTFLFHAANDGFVVESYADHAEGQLREGWIQEVVLSPRIVFAARQPTADELASLHERAHRGCFIAQSVKTTISVVAACVSVG